MLSSSRGRRRVRRHVEHDELTISFQRPEQFTFDIYVLDVIDLGFRFRPVMWSGTAKTLLNFARLGYVSPSHEKPDRVVQIEQRDLAASRAVLPLGHTDEETQKELLLSHTGLYARADQERWVDHVEKRPVTLEELGQAAGVLDRWRDRRREYHLLRAFIGDGHLKILASGDSEDHLMKIVERLVPLKDYPSLAKWHDDEHHSWVNERRRRYVDSQ